MERIKIISTLSQILKPTKQLPHPKYRADIDGLRAMAVMSVVVYHAFPNWLGGGFVGVDIFFVISGFLISSILFESLDKGTFSFAEFYAKRIKRIFPALLIVMASCYMFGWFVLLADEYKQLGRHIAGGAGFISNFLLWKEVGYFDTAAESKPLLHLWSLGIEEQFYILWPILLWWMWKRNLNLLTLAIALFLFFVLNLNGIHRDADGAFYLPQTRFWELLSGSIIAYVALNKKGTFEGSRKLVASYLSKLIYREVSIENGYKSLRDVWSILGFALICMGIRIISKENLYHGAYALMPVAGTVLIISAGEHAWVNRAILSSKLIVWFGVISYPLYLWHWPLLSFSRIVEGGVLSELQKVAIILVSILLSWITYALLEKRVRFGKSGHKTVVLILLMMITGYVGYNTYERDGLKFRMKKYESQMKQLEMALQNNASCRQIRSYATATCYESENHYQETMLIVGDSHMEALTHGFKKAFDSGEAGFNMLSIGGAGCSPFLNTEAIDGAGTAYGCEKIISSAINEALSRRDITWIVLVARYASRFDGSVFGEVEKGGRPWTYHYVGKNSISKDSQNAFELGLIETLNKAAQAGKRVVFVHQIPELGFYPRDCIRKNMIYKSACGISRQIVEERLSKYKNVAHHILESSKNVVEFDPIDIFCNQYYCSAFNSEGELMYRDDDHMSKISAEEIARNILKQMRAKPPSN